ncbi:MAG: DNA-binding response regulator [Anaerolineae bacterium]|jgi:two-component system response regulator MtrA|nr:MAG: DNA-binding response regulator [Anaerolineae bacterium]
MKTVQEGQPYRILYGDDDPDMQTLVRLILQRAGMQVDSASNGQEALDLWRRTHFDGVVLDVMMPVIDGLEICRRIRRLSQVPIILLTARGQEDEVVRGLEAGADDYVVKPIRQKEFLARLNVALKRGERMHAQEEQSIHYQDLVIHLQRRSVTYRGRPIHLTPLEFQLLVYLARKPGAIIPKRELFDSVWGYSSGMDSDYVDLNIVESAIRRLRRKLGEDAERPDLIVTVRGLGYQFGHV